MLQILQFAKRLWGEVEDVLVAFRVLLLRRALKVVFDSGCLLRFGILNFVIENCIVSLTCFPSQYDNLLSLTLLHSNFDLGVARVAWLLWSAKLTLLRQELAALLFFRGCLVLLK